MNSKFLSVISAVAIATIAASLPSHAAALTPGQFNAGVKAAIGTKKGKAAYTAAAAYYKKALTDKKNKSKAIPFTAGVLAALKKAVTTTTDVANSRAKLSDALINGYFSGLKYNPADAKFQQALKKLSLGLPKPLQTDKTAQLITKTLLAYNTKKGGGNAGFTAITGTVYKALHLTPPQPPS